MRRLLCGAIAVALLLLTRTTRADTIQPMLVGLTVSGGGYTYDYQLILTANNGLANDAPESGLIIPDFNGFTGVVFVAPSLGDSTVAGNWSISTPGSGAPALSGTSWASDMVSMTGTNATISTSDLSTVTNIVLKYTGPGLAVSTSARSLIHLYVESTIPLVSKRGTLSRDTGPDAGDRQVESFSAYVPNEGGGPFLPLPATANMGLVLLGGLGGIGGLRRLNSRRSVVA